MFSASINENSTAKLLTQDNQITLDLKDLQIDNDIFSQLHSSNSESYSISIDVDSDDEENPVNTLTFENLTTTAFNRAYKHIIIIPRDREAPTPQKILRSNTLIIGEDYDESRHNLKDTLLELKSEQSITSQVQLNADSLRPYTETNGQSPLPSEKTEITLLHGVAIFEVDIRVFFIIRVDVNTD